MHATPNLNLPRSAVLRLRRDFEQVRAAGQRAVGRMLVCNHLIRPGEGRQVAFIMPKAIGPAVDRNRTRRRLREIYRAIQHRLPEDLASVWIARKGAPQATFEALRGEVSRLYRKAGLLEPPGTEE